MIKNSASAFIERVARISKQAIADSLSVGTRALKGELYSMYKECRPPNWDGHDAYPMSWDSVRLAWQIIDTLPAGFMLPSLGAEPDGQVTLEWRINDDRMLSVSVDPSGLLHYAGRSGAEKHSGIIQVYGAAPRKLLRMVTEL